MRDEIDALKERLAGAEEALREEKEVSRTLRETVKSEGEVKSVEIPMDEKPGASNTTLLLLP